MAQKVVIKLSLVEESEDVSNGIIEKDILKELSNGAPIIPWCKEIEKVTVTES